VSALIPPPPLTPPPSPNDQPIDSRLPSALTNQIDVRVIDRSVGAACRVDARFEGKVFFSCRSASVFGSILFPGQIHLRRCCSTCFFVYFFSLSSLFRGIFIVSVGFLFLNRTQPVLPLRRRAPPVTRRKTRQNIHAQTRPGKKKNKRRARLSDPSVAACCVTVVEDRKWTRDERESRRQRRHWSLSPLCLSLSRSVRPSTRPQRDACTPPPHTHTHTHSSDTSRPL